MAGIIERTGNCPIPTILDVGCGTGEMYKFFLNEKITVDYTGIDVVPGLVTAAKKRFPDGRFELRDIFDLDNAGKPSEIPGIFDYVFASGALSFKVADNLNYYRAMIEKMYALAKHGLAFNMLNAASHVDDETYAAYDPKQIADFCHDVVARDRPRKTALLAPA